MDRLLPPALYAALANDLQVQLPGCTFALNASNIKLAEAEFLYRLVRHLRPQQSAEIGFCQGISTLAILQALADNQAGLHHVVDPFQSSWWRNAGVENVKQAGLEDRMRFYEKFVEEAAPGFPRLQFGFIDGSHLFDLSMVDFVLLDKKLEVGGVIGFHDLWMPALRRLLRFILNNRGYQVYQLPGDSSQPRSFRRAVKESLSRCYHQLPRWEALNGIFSTRLLIPYWTLGVAGNMVFLQKTAEDKRYYDFYREF